MSKLIMICLIIAGCFLNYQISLAQNNTAIANSVQSSSFEIGSWGGKVRQGPWMDFEQIASLSNGDVVLLLNKTKIIMNGFPWIKIRLDSGVEGYQWGGILCGIDSPVDGLFQTCTAPLSRGIKKPVDSNVSPAEKIENCVNTEKSKDKSGELCIGMIAEPCMNIDENFSTHDTRQCINTETEIWDARLNSNYQKLKDLLNNTEQKTALRDMQRSWIKFSKDFCALEYNLYKGTLYLVTNDICIMEMTAKQSLELKALMDTAVHH